MDGCDVLCCIAVMLSVLIMGWMLVFVVNTGRRQDRMCKRCRYYKRLVCERGERRSIRVRCASFIKIDDKQ